MAKPERLTNADLVAVLENAAEESYLPSLPEMRDELLRALYEQRNELKGIALVQGLKALEALARTEPGTADERDPTVREVVMSVTLEPERKRELLAQEQAKLEGELAEIATALEEL